MPVNIKMAGQFQNFENLNILPKLILCPIVSYFQKYYSYVGSTAL